MMEKSGNTAGFSDGGIAYGAHEDAGELRVRLEHMKGFERVWEKTGAPS